MTEKSPNRSVAERNDAICDQFERDFRAGRKPVLETLLLKATSAVRPALFRALLELEVELRQKAGETPKVTDYESRFPDHHQTIRATFEALRHQPSNVSSVNATGIDTSRGPVPKVKTPDKSGKPGPSALGRFEIKSVLGEGAFGTVYRARDPQLDRDVAVKVPKFAGQQSLEDRERFLREARAAAGLHHAQICPVHEIGTIDGVDYIVLAFIDGKPLSGILQTKPKLSNRQIVTVIRKLALALQEAHDKGIIHRDLKPANIMINRKGEPVIMDFGLARRSHSTDVQISHSGQIMGTPAYMSPEQARGDGKAVGLATDIYSLGIVLYEMICGRRPFEGTVTEVIGKILHVAAPPPAKFRPDVDERLQAICLKAIAKKPVDRFASMKEFATALADYARALPSGDRPASAPVIETGKEATTNQFAELLAAISSDVESKVERAVRRVERPHRMPWWSYLAGSALMGLIVLLGILFFIRKDTVTVIVSIPIENINDPALSFILDNNPIAAAAFAVPIELKPGQHELVVNKDGQLFKRFVFDVGAKQTDPVVVQDVTPNPSPTPEIVLERLQGRWIAVAQARSGAQLSPEELQAENKVMTITGDQFSIEYQLPKDRNIRGKEAGRIIRVNPSTVPAEIDMVMVFEGGNNEPLPFKGIYELQGDRLVHCYRKCHEKNDRPKDFTTVKGEAIFMVEYQRASAAIDGYVSLFNGKDLTGWTPESNDIENWKVQDGAIVATDARGDFTKESWLLSEKSYGDFVARFEFLAENTLLNSGFAIRAVPGEKATIGNPPRPRPRPAHVQVELLPAEPGARSLLTAIAKTGDVIGNYDPQVELYSKLVAEQKPAGQWNEMEVELIGQSIRVRLNGKLIQDASLDALIKKGGTAAGLKRRDGRIGFQRLNGAVRFRDIQIKELKPTDDGWTDLFNGKDLSNWTTVEGKAPPWKVENGYMEVVPGTKSIATKDNFPLDFELHVEFWMPKELNKNDQARGNSGVYLHGRHEIQICDGYQNPIAKPNTACGGLFGEIAPALNACKAPETWQTFDITYFSPRIDANKFVTKSGRLTVNHNNQKVVNDETFRSITGAGLLNNRLHNNRIGEPGPIMLQDHGSPVRFRNIRLRPLAPLVAADDGWTELFKDNDLTGWQGKLNQWSLKDGLLIGRPGTGNRKTFLFSPRKYADFELKFQVRIAANDNSGVQIRSQILDPRIWTASGPQCEIGHRPEDYWGGVYSEEDPNVGGWMLKPDRPASVKTGDWNDYWIRCNGQRVTIQVNGATTVDGNLAFMKDTGLLAFQIHADNQYPVEFRNIRIRQIGAVAPSTRTIPADTRVLNGHSYKFFPEQLSWKAAKARCEALGGHLVIIETPAENAFLGQLITDGGQLDSWIGATDEGSEGQWHWVDGRLMTWTNWFTRQKQPNNKGGVEHFGLMSNQKLAVDGLIDWKWSDQPDESLPVHQPGYICEWDAAAP